MFMNSKLLINDAFSYVQMETLWLRVVVVMCAVGVTLQCGAGGGVGGGGGGGGSGGNGLDSLAALMGMGKYFYFGWHSWITIA